MNTSLAGSKLSINKSILHRNCITVQLSFRFPQVSYSSGSPKFESQLTYPNTYRAAPSSTSYSKAKVAFIKHYGWKRVAILYEYDPEYFSPVNCFKTLLRLTLPITKYHLILTTEAPFSVHRIGSISAVLLCLV